MRSAIGFLVLAFAVAPGHAAETPLEGFGTAVVDGVVGPREWDAAARLDFAVNLPGGGTTAGTLFVMNDELNLYLAVRFARADADALNSAGFDFDNDDSGGFLGDGDDALLISPPRFFDAVRTTAPPCPPQFLCGFHDVSLGGTTDGAGAFGNDGSYSTYEFSHPLDSDDDAHDFSLRPGDTFGYRLSLTLGDDTALADTYVPNWFGRIRVAAPERTVGFVTRQGHGEVAAVDLTDGTILTVYDTDAQSPVEIAFSPDGARFYVTNAVQTSQGPRVEFFDVEGGLSGSAPVGEVPVEIAVLPDGTKIFTADWWGGSVSVVDAATRTLLATIPTGFLANDVTVDPDGTRVYATSVFAEWISVIDTVTDRIVATIPLGTTGARHLALTPDGAKAYVNVGDAILKIDLATAAVEASIPFDSSGGNANNIDLDLEIDPAGAFAYANGASVVHVIDLSRDEVVRQIPVAPAGMRLDDVAVDRTGSFVYVTTSPESIELLDRSEIVKIRTADFSIRDRFVVGDVLAGLALRPMPQNAAPVALCADVTATADSACEAEASVDGGSFDPDGGTIVVEQSPPGPYGPGRNPVRLSVIDEHGSGASCTAAVTVVDDTPPALSVALDRDLLWPPSHQMVDVEARIAASDNCGTPAVELVSLTSNEADDAPGAGDGHTSDDIGRGIDDFHFALRAERAATGGGRVYTVTYRATDGSGNSAPGESQVTVPHDRGGVVDPLTIAVAESADGTVLSWRTVPGAESYDVVRGELDGLGETTVEIDLGHVVCIEAGSPDESTRGREDVELPRPGKGFFYLVASYDGTGSTYGTESAGRPRTARSGDCP